MNMYNSATSDDADCGLQTKHIIQALENIMPVIHRTPLKKSTTFNQLSGLDLYFKMENLQRTGSFKIRGALNKITSLTKQESSKGVIAASAGNHAQGVAYSAAKRGLHSKIFMPEKTPMAKVNATRSYGSDIILVGESYQEAYEAASQEQLESGATFIHAFDDIDVMAGQGTIALEMVQQCPDLDAIVVPVGGGGLISGIATLIKNLYPKIKVIGVQALGAAPTFNRFTGAGNFRLSKVNSIADGISVKETGKLTYPLIHRYVDDIVTVTDEEIAFAMVLMLEREKTFVEGAGAAAFAAVLSRKLEWLGRRVGIIVSGGNADLEKLPLYKRLSKPVENLLRKIG